MKARNILRRTMISSSLLIVSAILLHAGPSPDLMNSIAAMRIDAQKTTKPPNTQVQTWSRTHTITAGQSTIAVPDTSRTSIEKKEIQLAPLNGPKIEKK